MLTAKLEELISKREKFVEASKENKFKFDAILSGIYDDPSHFIYEILQNAEDAYGKRLLQNEKDYLAKAKGIKFILSNDKLEVFHYGKDFDFEDIDSITGFDLSTKKDDITSIGKFGIGFKSVYAVTESPIIHSGEFNFKIEEVVVPRIIENSDTSFLGKTKIIIPFYHSKKGKEQKPMDF